MPHESLECPSVAGQRGLCSRPCVCTEDRSASPFPGTLLKLTQPLLRVPWSLLSWILRKGPVRISGFSPGATLSSRVPYPENTRSLVVPRCSLHVLMDSRSPSNAASRQQAGPEQSSLPLSPPLGDHYSLVPDTPCLENHCCTYPSFGWFGRWDVSDPYYSVLEAEVPSHS